MRVVVRPVVSVVLSLLNFLHDNLNVGYGWVLMIFGVLMRALLFPINQKAMRAQMKNMAVQPLLQDIQTKYKDQPEKLQKEMMKLYKDHGFNPLASHASALASLDNFVLCFSEHNSAKGRKFSLVAQSFCCRPLVYIACSNGAVDVSPAVDIAAINADPQPTNENNDVAYAYNDDWDTPKLCFGLEPLLRYGEYCYYSTTISHSQGAQGA